MSPSVKDQALAIIHEEMASEWGNAGLALGTVAARVEGIEDQAPRIRADVQGLKFQWGHQSGDDWIYRIGPNQVRSPRATLEDCAVDAVTMLKAAYTVYWEPGDGTSYQVRLLVDGNTRYLAFLNASFPGLLPLRTQTTVGDYVRSSAPQGGWLGIKPLLVALSAARPGSSPYDLSNRLDAIGEAAERASQHRTQYVADDDAELGRQIRLLVQAKVSRG